MDESGSGIKSLDKDYTGKISIPKIYNEKTITKICQKACYNGLLSAIDISQTVITVIEGDAFFNCTNLVEITFCDSVETIQKNAFYQAIITSISLPKSLNEFDGFAFNQCQYLTTIDISNNNNKFQVKNNVVYTKDYYKLILVPRNLVSISQIPDFDKITGIGQCAFTKTNITQIIASEKLQSLDSFSFHAMYKCNLIDLSKSKITSIPSHTFRFNYAYRIILPYMVTEICSQSFYKSFSSIIILKYPLVTIQENAFQDSYELRKIYYFGVADFSSTAIFTGETDTSNLHIYVTPDYPKNSFGGISVSRGWLYHSCKFEPYSKYISYISIFLLSILCQ